jgi:hypothetical protein
MIPSSSVHGLLICALASLALHGPGLRAQQAEEEVQVPVTLGADGWMIYKNARFGAVIPVPPGMRALIPPYNGDGQAFASLDNKVQFHVYSAFFVEGTDDIDARYKTDLDLPGRKVTYKRKTKDWYVVSGVSEDGSAFYERFTANKKYVSGWGINYPHAEEKKYAPWIERIAKGYEPRFGQGEDTVE